LKREENIALFDDYLTGLMSAEEMNAFEEKLKVDESFRKEFEEYKAYSTAIFEGEEYGQIRQSLEEIHRDVYPPKTFFLRKPFLIAVSTAAILVLSLLIIDPFGLEGGEMAVEANEYNELSGVEEGEVGEEDVASEEAYVEADTNEGVTDVHLSPEMVITEDSLLDAINKKPLGTAFLISEKGYFITAKHLLRKKKKVTLQQKKLGLTFHAKKVYVDSLLDFAILQCDPKVVDHLSAVPFRFYKKQMELGEEVFTLGYPKRDIVYTEGNVSSETGFKSDTNYFEISMPSNPGYSGAPLFNQHGDLVGIITANNSKKQSVTYAVRHDYIEHKIDELMQTDSLNIDMRTNYRTYNKKRSEQIKKIRPFIFEIHRF
jgi:S1-C subfamily serine protease